MPDFQIKMDEQQVLDAMVTVMADRSEEFWCASWLRDIEHHTFDEMNVWLANGSEEEDDEHGQLSLLHVLMQGSGCWVADEGDINLMPLDEWLPIHAEWLKKHR